MNIIISGYGSKPEDTIAQLKIDENMQYELQWKASIDNASFVCQGEGYMFTITEAGDYACIYSFKQVGEEILFVDQLTLEGGSLCHIVYSSINKALIGACYETGTVFSVQVREGRFTKILTNDKHRSEEKSNTRAHCILLNQKEDTVIVTNIALDQIYFYHIHKGILDRKQIIDVPTGVGPRHIIYSLDEIFLYVITEYSNEILVYRNDVEKELILIQRISTLPQDFIGDSNCSTLCLSKNNSYLYAANRGADSIMLFSVKQDGTLKKEKDFPCGGMHPRHMIITKDDNYIVICNQNSNLVTIFPLKKENGFIEAQVASITFPSPSGIIEL